MEYAASKFLMSLAPKPSLRTMNHSAERFGGMTRRRCLGLTTLASLTGAFLPWHSWAGRAARAREYHLCLNPQAVLQDPDFPALVARAGVSCVLGIKAVYLGAEKAGIRLADYRGVPLRVGELMFDDQAFSPLKGKIDEGRLVSSGTRFVSRSTARVTTGVLEPCEETLATLFALKHRLGPTLRKVPFVENDEPAVLAWYPSAHAALLWNVRPELTTFLVRCGAQNREVRLGGLESALVPDLHL
jgi:hypothetical protein